MPIKTIKKFEVKYLQILDENGNCDKKLKPSLSNAEIKKIYELMTLTREFDNKAIKLQRQGRLGTFASVKGQEACQVASAILFQNNDLAFPAFREHGVYLTRGMPLEMLFNYWGGSEDGMKIPKGVNVFTVSIPVGSHLPHAVGAAMAFKYQKIKAATISYFGDGATSTGDFHESLNFAGTFNLPAVFICQNNQFAISMPIREQTASETIAQKAIAYGINGIKVDGNDVFAVYQATKEALEKARNGKGATLIECFTYRLGDHTTSDDASRYRTEKEVKEWEKKDPIVRLEKYMQKKNIAEKNYFEKVKADAVKKVARAVEIYEKTSPPKREDIFNYTYSELTSELKDEMKEM